MTDTQQAASSLTKDELERQKLFLEIKYVRRTFLVQVLNAFTLAGIAVVVFLFFQRPQLDQMAETRAALETQHVENTLVGIFNMKNDVDKKLMLDHLRTRYPHLKFLEPMSKSFEPKPEPMKNSSEPIGQKCAEVRAEIDKQKQLLDELTVSFNAEISGVKARPNNSGIMGAGPIFRYLRDRTRATEEYVSRLQDELSSAKCR